MVGKAPVEEHPLPPGRAATHGRQRAAAPLTPSEAAVERFEHRHQARDDKQLAQPLVIRVRHSVTVVV
jgi:hypothetical protein